MFKIKVRILNEQSVHRQISNSNSARSSVWAVLSTARAYKFAICTRGRGGRGNVLNLITVNTLALLKRRCSVCNRLHERIILRNEKVSWEKKKKKEKSSWNEIYFFTRLYFHEKISFMYLIYNSRLTFYYFIIEKNLISLKPDTENIIPCIHIYIYIRRMGIKFSTIF